MKSNYTWKYKVVKENGYSIRRVHYKGKKAILMADKPTCAYGDTRDELIRDIKRMLDGAKFGSIFIPPKNWK